MSDKRRVPLDEWQTEEQRIPTITLDEQGKPQLGERVVKRRYIYASLIPHAICADGAHYYEIVDGGRRQDGRVLVKCRHCPLGRQFVPGVHRLEDGKLLPFRQP